MAASVDRPGSNSPGGRVGREHGRQFVDLYRDKIGRVLGNVSISREHHGDRFAHIAHTVPRQDRLPVGGQALDTRQAEVDRRNRGYVGRSPNRDDARQRTGGARLNCDDAAVGYG